MTEQKARRLAKKRLSAKRYQHTLNVRRMAVKLAKRWGADPEKAALAALLHDTAKELPREEMLQILKDNAIMAENAQNRPSPVWHGICAAILAQTQWGVEDEEVLSAIRCHTTGKPGMTELELQAELIYCMYKNGGTGLAFDPIVVSGPNTSLPHGVAGERVIQKGDFVTMDFGASYMGYCSDMTRTVAVGYATDEMKHVYDTVLKAQLTAIAATKAGVPGKEIDGTARKVIADAGYGEYFGHGYGHSLGLEIHENPSPNASNTEPLPAGVVCSAEPGIYLPGKFGVRIEDVTIITEDGCEDITGSPKNLIIL